MDLEAVRALRASLSRLCRADKRKQGDSGLANNDALYYARALPAEAVRTIIAGENGAKNMKQICYIFSALAPAGMSFREDVSQVLPDLVKSAAAAVAKPSGPSSSHRARQDLACIATLINQWSSSYPEERALHRVFEQVREEYSALDDELRRILRIREETERAAGEEVARSAGEQPPLVSTMEASARGHALRVEILLDQVKTLFSILGARGLKDLSSGGPDGAHDALHDIWAELILVERDCDSLVTQASLRRRLDDSTLHSPVLRESQRCRDLLVSLRSLLERIANERSYCEAMGVRVPAKPVSQVALHSVADQGFAESSSGEEWEDAVCVRDVSDSEEEPAAVEVDTTPRLADVSEENLSQGRRTLPTALAQLSRTELLAAVSSRAAGVAHNASAMATANAGEVKSPAKSSSTNSRSTGRQRLKAKLSKKRKRSTVQLSP